MIETNFVYLIFIIGVALAFDFTNGMHDAANSIATIVSTKVLSPRLAVVWAAVFNFIAFLIFGTAVAKTIGKGLIDVSIVTPTVVLAGLLGAIGWNMITWYFGLPTSSSHALIGGYTGAAVARGGFGVILTAGWTKTIIFIFLAPMIGMFLGGAFITAISWILHINKARPKPVVRWSRHTQLVSAALYSLGHGGNDAQKTMGIIASLLLSAGVIKTFFIPLWVVLAAHAAIGLGTLSGGWRIVKTMGQKIAKLRPIDGSCAETASAVSLFGATWLGVPVSTTHVITGAISGTVAARRFNAVHWDVTGRIVWAWFFTIPAASLLAAIVFYLLSLV
ncbi:inorganic phosphate transporter [Candidatus Nomurabacteria bacterium RIFCSPLOWO2_01_FULL_41_12]|uniref:Inorganic phosphate transporter n=1 Tax=Candidatus Nomurabacteria bacterium RIFCSPLOWO2_01_FULL_41_12 TaxID=1801774 RepID=A0A1F6WWW1_9BACT|nr:MAG: inorganic phosphate transporter [Candidatus Nomurabacteria bacterium RIFCSPHIGHO2_01_FULL_40_10]OGI86376.1 MAG: inorganic phosphate transporter [Candidatus Nomurabacteria bacterium RIFCSPLOWO2_01_FULL_41_12]